ncbi:interferon-induced very large GTPase 1 [Alligator mississippiensis]|uniref:interferon-induced very large GTPase 1 n=1 Tax=Alligator mississippiensis TaxID=8496 RepID=UPI0028779769|nr:interferon-induced very large GTPase 1 [Alligator mississippiensis]
MSAEKEEPNRPVQKDPGEKELAKRLQEVGLSADYWLPKLQKQFGVTSAQGLKHLRQKDYLQLEHDVQYTWEKQALQELFKGGIKARMKQQQQEHSDLLKSEQEQAKAALRDLGEMQQKGRTRHEAAVQKKEEELRKAMGIPLQYWVASEKPLAEVIETMHKQLNDLKDSAPKGENIPDEEVLRQASGGLALQGIYRTDKLEDLLEKREPLITVPDRFKLSGPEQGPLFEKKEFSSFRAESTFTKTMEKLGFSTSVAAKGGYWGFSAETSTDYSTASEHEETHRSCSEHMYICTAMCSYIPLASCYFPKDQLRLSSPALQELTGIEQLLSRTPEPDRLEMLKSRCGGFFTRFGSHVNQGPLHFGGIFWWKASSEGFRAERLDEVKKQTSDALNSYVGGSFTGFGFSVAGGVSVSNSSSKTSLQGTEAKMFKAEIQLSVTQTGGPAGVDSHPSWRSGLVASNKTWCVIDRGSQLIPVWDVILSNHRQDFGDVYEMSRSLMRAYEALTKQWASMLVGEQLVSAMEEARAFLEDMKSWEVTGEEEQLVKLIHFKQKLNDKTKDNNAWVNLCLSDKVLQDFLANTVLLCQGSPAQNTMYIKHLLQCLLEPYDHSVKHCPQFSSIMQWISHAEEKHQEPVCISEFAHFIKALQQLQDDMEEPSLTTSSAAVEEAKVKASVKVNLALCSCLKALGERGQADIQLLLLSIAVSMGYCVESKTFNHLLGCSEINFMIKEMQRAHKRYLTLRDQKASQAHAFQLLTGLTIAPEFKDVSPEQKRKRLAFMKQHMGNSLSAEVCQVLAKHHACDDWSALERDLNCLVNGELETSRGDLQMQAIITELSQVCRGDKQIHSPKLQPKGPPCQVDQPEGSQVQDFLHLIQRLGLENYYPRKMGRADFHVIDKTLFQDSLPRTDSELPFYFLQKLLMVDYRVRYLVCKDDSETKKGIPSTLNTMANMTESSNESSDIYDDFLEEGSEGTHKSAAPRQAHVHPIDIQMAIFHCADDFTRQYVSTKLAFCQFALPLLVPNPCTSNIEFPLWSLSQVQKSWNGTEKTGLRTSIKNYKNKLIYQVDTPVVSFMRIGNSSSSKSKILNALLSEHKHDIFFHRDCRGSSKDCLLMGGVVEIFWYCPSGKDDDRFDNCIAFTNLHGDAREHKQQVGFLQEISSLNVLLLTTSDENEVGKQLVRDLLKSPKPFVCLFTEKENIVAGKSNLKIKIALKNRNEAELIDELAKNIKDLLVGSKPCSLNACAEIARQHGFLIDEDRDECKEAKAMAQTLIALFRENDLQGMKENLLPLQGELWHKWCKKDKELTGLEDKRNKSIEQHRSDIESEKRAIREEQLRRAFPLNDLMRSVLDIIQSHSKTIRKYFLQWMKLFMDDLSSECLTELHQKYHVLWSQMKGKKHLENNDGSENLVKTNLEKLLLDISASTIGLEHILREIGQIYEALDILPQVDKRSYELPQIAADLMVSGYPIELMDGDASYVPLKWVRAVFDRVIEKLGDKKVFVLSVLGIQSTGKSTLLNAMFGLQFNVSAGRCTRGAFMQLIKVDEKIQQHLSFDYILVVDTEGLRATELATKSTLNHDNELATFVIGLGNMTLINIFGENPSEMQDILQIAVQAFLRMKQVRLSPSCLFVHQNVGEITAKEQNMAGQRRLQQRLDEMTVTAAQQEFCDVTCFSDVIRFDVNSHVHYFAHLWEGNPPMAPPNPSYSQNVQELKSKILLAAKKEPRGSVLRLSELKVRIGDLWNALLNEKFVFSFKNTLEIAAYNRLEATFSQWTWELRSHVLDMQTKLNNLISKGEVQCVTRRSLEKEVQKKYDTIMKDTERYFNEDQDCELSIQWKASIENKLKDLKESLIEETKRKSEELIELKKKQSKLDGKKSEYETELFKKSKDLALDLKGKKLNEEALRGHFDFLWNTWIYEVSSSAPRAEDPNISRDIENIFLEHFKQEPNIEKKINNLSCDYTFSIDESKHIIMKKTRWPFSKTLDKSDRKNIEQVGSHIMQLVSMNIDTKERERTGYNRNYIHEILNLIRKEVESASHNQKYTFTNEYRVDLSLHLCQMAAGRFKYMHTVFKKANDPALYLESKREDFFKCFQISCHGATSITTFADFFCLKLSAALRQAVYNKTAISIADEMKSNHPAFNGNRSKLETHILIYLAEEENFEKYRQYIHFPRDFLEGFIKKCIEDYCLDNRSRRLKNFLNASLDFFQTLLLSAIYSSTRAVKDKNGNVSLWLDEFCSTLGDNLDLPRSELKSIEHQEIKDIEFLKEAVSQAFAPVIENLRQEFAATNMEQFTLKPHQILVDQFSGCWEQCPFCKALCTNTIPGHDGDHSVRFHRPQALNGVQWDGTDHLVIDICSSLVASDCFMVLHGNQQIKYKNYRKAGPAYANWSITPDKSTQAYWKWFVCHFRSILEEDYCAKFEGKGAIPPAWEAFTKEAVISELRQ